MSCAEGCQGGDGHGAFGDADALAAIGGGGVGMEGGPAVAVVEDFVEGERAVGVGDAEVEIDIAGSFLCKRGEEAGVWLDIDAGPAEVVEALGDGVEDGVVGTDIDVEASVGREGAGEQDVFEVLRVGDLTRGEVVPGEPGG